VKYENYTTAREMSMMLEKIYKGKMVDPLSSELMLEILKRRKTRSRLAKGLPPGWEIAHKTGLLRGACHDAAIIFAPEGEYVLTVLTGQNRSYASAKKFISQIGRITYRHFNSGASLYARASTKSSALENASP
jgi:beta-lactamase class A